MKNVVVAALALALVGLFWAASRTDPREVEPLGTPPSDPRAREDAARVPLQVEEPGALPPEVLESSGPTLERRTAAGTPTPDLLVRLLDVTGRAVDQHPIRVSPVPGLGDVDDGRKLYGKTDGEGLARFARAELETLSPHADFQLRVEIGTRHPDPPRKELLLSEVTSEAIELRIALGRLVIAAREPDGTLWTGRHGALVRPDGFHYHSSAGATPIVLWVPLGVPYGVKVYGCGLYREVEQDFPPLAPSDSGRVHVLLLARSYPALRGVAVDEAGKPLPARTVLRFRDHDRNGQGSRLTFVREEGEFVYPLGLGESEGQTRTFAITMDRDGKLHGYAADVTFDVPVDGECADVGTIGLAARPILAAGRVVPPEGYRAEGIPVHAEVQDDAGRWRRHPELDNCAFTDEDGSFAVFASDVGGPYRVRVSTSFRGDLDCAISSRAPGIEYGATDLVFPLVWTGSLEVGVDEDDVRLPRRLQVALHHFSEGSGEEVELVRSAGKGHGLLEFSELLPGRARLELRTRDGQVLAERDGLRIEPRRTTEAGTLTPDPTLTWLRLHPLGEARTARVLVRTAGSGSFDREWSWRSNDTYLAVPSLPVDLLVRSPGYRQELLRNVDGDVELSLREGPRIELRLTGISGLAGSNEGATVHLVGRLEPVDIQPDPPVPSAPEFDAKQFTIEPTDADSMTLHLELDEPGRYAVSFLLRVADDGTWRDSAASSAGDLVIDLDGGAFEIHVPDLEFPR